MPRRDRGGSPLPAHGREAHAVPQASDLVVHPMEEVIGEIGPVLEHRVEGAVAAGGSGDELLILFRSVVFE